MASTASVRVLVTGHRAFLDRYAPLGAALGGQGLLVDRLDAGNLNVWLPVRVYNRLTRRTPLHDRLFRPDPNPAAFARRSRLAARAIRRRVPPPDVVLHIFGSFAPAWRGSHVPYAMYLDFTMAQAARQHPAWAAFASNAARERWLSYERQAYAGASEIFTMGDETAEAVIAEYGVPPSRVTVVGSGGPVADVYEGDKTFGSLRILADLSDFHRKGGDILVSAIERVRQDRPAATLVMIGRRLDAPRVGVEDLGFVRDPQEMRRLFLSADLAVSAARCDPFPGFLIEAMGHGLPVMTSRRTGLARQIEAAGAGVVVRGDAPESYAEAIAALLGDSDRLAGMGAAARQLARTSLNWTAVAARMATRLRKAAASARGESI